MASNAEFEPLVVLQFSPSIPATTKSWVVERITARHDDDEGAEFLARFENEPESRDTMLLIGATLPRLLLGAEELRLKKSYKDKGLREFLISDHDDSEDPASLLLTSEKQRIIWEELQNLRPKRNDHAVPGVPIHSISPENDTILGVLRSLDFLVNVFPLHDKEEIKLLERDWFGTKNSFFKSQDIQKIRDYFGENVAFYFAFLEYYTKALIPTAILGLLVSIWPSSDFLKYSLFAIFNVLWWTVVMERWKRLTNKLAYQWGSLDQQVFERARALYHGDLYRSPITNQLERRYPTWKRTMKKYAVTYPVMMISLVLSLTLFFTYYGIQQSTNDRNPLDGSMMFLRAKAMRIAPSAGYSLLIIPINQGYKKLATYLTDFENHRLQTAYENNLTAKLFVFFFVNCFAGLFYEAFFVANYSNVAQLLTTLVIVNAILLKFTEQIGPYLFKRVKKDPPGKVSEAVKQAKTLTSFDGTYGDYLTIFEQYGYVALFSAVFPWVTICALVNNVFELRADAFKYCYVYQRPFARVASNIGSWHNAFDVLSSVAIVTNTALIAMQPSVREYFSSYTDVEYILIFVAAEHILLALKFAIDFAIPDVPHEVQIERAKSLFESNQALRRERQRRSTKAQTSLTKF